MRSRIGLAGGRCDVRPHLLLRVMAPRASRRTRDDAAVLRAADLASACARFLLAGAPTPHASAQHARRTLAPCTSPGMVARAVAALRPAAGRFMLTWDRFRLCWSRL